MNRMHVFHPPPIMLQQMEQNILVLISKNLQFQKLPKIKKFKLSIVAISQFSSNFLFLFFLETFSLKFPTTPQKHIFKNYDVLHDL